MKRVWSHPRGRAASASSAAAKGCFGASNTLLVDTEPRKAREWLANTITPSEYTKDKVLLDKKKKKKKKKKQGQQEDRTLYQLRTYLDETLLLAMQKEGTNLPDVLRLHPYKG